MDGVKITPLKWGKIENSDEEIKAICKESISFQGKKISHGSKLWVSLEEMLRIICNEKLNDVFNIDFYRNKCHLRNFLFNRKYSGKYIVNFSNKKVRYTGFSVTNGLINEKLLMSQVGDIL